MAGASRLPLTPDPSPAAGRGEKRNLAAAGPEDGQLARRQVLREYWGALKIVLADLEVTDDEVAYMEKKKRELQLAPEEIRLQHARAFASVIAQFTEDQWLDDRECLKLNRLHRALARLGWAPGE